jgi:PAS domain S-box-containing protein
VGHRARRSRYQFLHHVPRALFWSPDPRDAIFEVFSIMFIGIVVCLWSRSRVGRLQERQKAAATLNSVQRELESNIRLAHANEIRLQMLNAISGMLPYSQELEALVSGAISMVMEVMDVEVVRVYSLVPESQELKLVAWKGLTSNFVEETGRLKLDESHNGLVARTGEPFQEEDASSETEPTPFSKLVRDEKIKAQLIVPLKNKGQTTGTLCISSRQPRKFTREEVQLLTAIGNQIAIAIENARLYYEQQTIATRYRGIFENASDAIWVEDLEGNILTANQATARLTGYDREELVHMKLSSFLRKDKLSREVAQRLLQGESSIEPYDQQLVRKDRSEVQLMLVSNLITRDGKPAGFQHVARDVSRERQAEENLRFYVEEITHAQEEERKRIARELHDETAQQLIALGHQLEDFARNSQSLNSADIELLESWRGHLKETLQGVRRFTRDLRPPMLDDLGLVSSVEWLADELRNVLGIKVNMKVTGPERRFKPKVEMVFFRVIQEALANTRRHSEASAVEVALEFKEDKTTAVIKDNGKGFDVPRTLGDMSRLGKLGLIGMEERARLIGGTVAMQSSPGAGTTITVVIPA